MISSTLYLPLTHLDYHSPYPIFKDNSFAGDSDYHFCTQLVPVLDGPTRKRIFLYMRPLPTTPNFPFMIYSGQIVWPL